MVIAEYKIFGFCFIIKDFFLCVVSLKGFIESEEMQNESSEKLWNFSGATTS